MSIWTVVAIDPGHGGQDPGALGDPQLPPSEEDVTLQISLLLRDRLLEKGFLPVLTRDHDVTMDLLARAKLANDKGAALFLSVHVNSAEDASAAYYSTWIYRQARPETRHWARIVHRRMLAVTGFPDGGIREAEFVVLRATRMPAILVELGFISNPAHEQLMREAAWLRQVADGLASAVADCLGEPAPALRLTPLFGRTAKSVGDARAYLAAIAPGWEEIADHTWELAPGYALATGDHLRPEVALALMLHETGCFRFGGLVRQEQNNFGGLGATGPGQPGASFGSRREGVEAVLQHLWAYACAAPLPAGRLRVDPRFDLVDRGSAPALELLAGKWAHPGYDARAYTNLWAAFSAGDTYGQVIRDRYLLPFLSRPGVADDWDWAVGQGLFSSGASPSEPPTRRELATALRRLIRCVDGQDPQRAAERRELATALRRLMGR